MTRLGISFFLFGLINNGALHRSSSAQCTDKRLVLYVIILSAALDLVPPSTPKGIIAFCNIAPSLGAKVAWPYLLKGKIRYTKRLLGCCALAFSGMLVSPFDDSSCPSLTPVSGRCVLRGSPPKVAGDLLCFLRLRCVLAPTCPLPANQPFQALENLHSSSSPPHTPRLLSPVMPWGTLPQEQAQQASSVPSSGGRSGGSVSNSELGSHPSVPQLTFLPTTVY